MSESLRETALAKLQQIESQMFQFGQRVRAFLQDLPADLPQPFGATPALASSGIDQAYLHLTFATPAEVASWASWMDAAVTRKDELGAVFCHATAVVDGLPIYVGCMQLATEAEQQTGGEDR
ncbi:hypothetical protein ACFUJT_07680 [Streptomyces griseoincarnatus]